MRFPRLFKKSANEAAARRIYVLVVEQSRLPAFYLGCGVPDTPDGRFDMIALHAALVLRRLKQDGPLTSDLAQAVFDLMFADMDQNLREMGIGDIGVGMRVKGMAQGFYGRLAAYDAALAASDNGDLEAALRRNLFRKAFPTKVQVAAVARYMQQEARQLDIQETQALVAGDVRFGPPPGIDSGENG